MTNIYCLVTNGKLYMKGSLSSIEREIQKFNLTQYLVIKYEEYQKTRITDKKKKNKVMTAFNWKRLPESEYEHVKNLIERQKFNDLLLLHDKYKLSSTNFCCGNMVRVDMFNQWKWKYNQGFFDLPTKIETT